MRIHDTRLHPYQPRLSASKWATSKVSCPPKHGLLPEHGRMNERIRALRERTLSSYYERAAEVERLRKESLDQTAGEPAVLREAKASAHCDRNRTVA
ncbi:MAG: hypothetical protein FJ278_14105, partial [Planctomycetes bacterium]|nr:hypothetical protein [Planctomycetota bacterium]